MLKTAEYEEIRRDYDAISCEYFSRDYHPPAVLSFSNSDALFPSDALQTELGREYERQCRLLCYGAYPSWKRVLETFARLRSIL
jgi:hypothetical protein